MKISKLEGKRVALWGWGREGRAAFAVLRERLPLPLSLFCPAVEVGAARMETQGALDVRGEPSAEALAAFDVVIKSPGISPYQPIALAAARRAPPSSAALRCGSPSMRLTMASCTTPCA